MIFGISVTDSLLPGGFLDVTLDANHYEAFLLLVVHTHGFGPKNKKRLGHRALEDKVASYGVDFSDPQFKKALRMCRKRSGFTRSALPSHQLTVSGTELADAIERNSESFPVGHPLPTIEALAATLRFGQTHALYPNSGIEGGTPIKDFGPQAVKAIQADFPDLADRVVDGEIPPEKLEALLERILGTGIVFLYERHLYRITPGFPRGVDHLQEHDRGN